MTTKTVTEKEVIPIEPEIIEEAEEVEPEKEVILPPRFGIYPIPKDNPIPPKTSYPYFPMAKQGLYLQRPLIFGTALIPQKTIPTNIPKIDEDLEDGMFTWEIEPIPASICASIVAWFKHIYEKQKTEVEVLLLLNHTTMEWKVWIPTQQVSHTGVKSVYEPSDLPKGYTLVGSMHSHCDFSAFHSSTDTGDAQEFDGVHLTVGHIMRDEPEVVAMVMVNKLQFNYKDISLVADFSDLSAGTFEDYWDDFVTENSNVNSGHRPKGWELFQKYTPPTPTIRAVTPWVPNVAFNNWERFKQEQGSPQTTQPYKDSFNEDDENSLLYAYLERKYGVDKDVPKEVDDYTDSIIGMFDEAYWEDGLPTRVVDAIVMSKTIQEKDLDYVCDNPQDGKSIMFWRNLYFAKIASDADVLSALGIEVSYRLRPKKYTQGDS